MDLRKVAVVYRKELIDLLRDRKTVLSLVLFPLVFFPLMTVGFGTVERKMRDRVRGQESLVMILGEEHAPSLAQAIRETEKIRVVPAADDYVDQLNFKKLHAAVQIPQGFAQAPPPGGDPPHVKILFYSTQIRSETAATRLEETIRQHHNQLVEQRTSSYGLTPEMLNPVTPQRQNVADPQRVGGMKLGMLLPYFITFLCVVGAMGPAIDLTAGEKERGTLETILASGIGRGELVMGKFLTVLTGSLTTTLFSIGSFALTVLLAEDYMKDMTRGQAYTVSVSSVFWVLVLIVPLAVLFSAVMMTVTLFAKSFKEGQTQGSMVMFAAIVPAMVGMLPGIDLNPTLAILPVLNVSLVLKEILTGVMPWGMMGLTFASSCAYAALALKIATQTFQKESVLFRV